MELISGNIVKLKPEKFEEVRKYFLFPQNIFIIDDIKIPDDVVTLKGLYNFNIHISDIESLVAQEINENEISSSTHNKVFDYNLSINTVMVPSRIKVRELGTLVTLSNYDRLLQKNKKLIDRQLVFFSKKIKEGQKDVSTKQTLNSSYVLILKPEYEHFSTYLSFFFDSKYAKFLLLNTSPVNEVEGKSNMKAINDSYLFYLDGQILPCVAYQLFVDYIFSVDSSKSLEVKPLFDFLRMVRDIMVMEICMPSFFRDIKVQIVESWILEINKVPIEMLNLMDGKASYDLVKKVFNSLFSEKNELMQNINKFRLYSNEIIKKANI